MRCCGSSTGRSDATIRPRSKLIPGVIENDLWFCSRISAELLHREFKTDRRPRRSRACPGSREMRQHPKSLPKGDPPTRAVALLRDGRGRHPGMGRRVPSPPSPHADRQRPSRRGRSAHSCRRRRPRPLTRDKQPPMNPERFNGIRESSDVDPSAVLFAQKSTSSGSGCHALGGRWLSRRPDPHRLSPRSSPAPPAPGRLPRPPTRRGRSASPSPRRAAPL